MPITVQEKLSELPPDRRAKIEQRTREMEAELRGEEERRAILRRHKTRRRAGTADAAIGAIIRRQRAAMGLSQGELADMIGVTSQQVHKYETGDCKVDAVRLFEICRLLGTPMADIEREVMSEIADRPAGPAKLPSVHAKLEMARLCARIDANKMSALLQMARALVPEEEPDS